MSRRKFRVRQLRNESMKKDIKKRIPAGAGIFFILTHKGTFIIFIPVMVVETIQPT